MPDGADATAATGSAPVPLASALAGGPTAFVRADVALDGEPIVGSFTVDGMTFAVVDGGSVELVGVAPDRQQVASSQEGDGSPVAPMLASEPDGASLAVPESVAYEGIDYAVTSIGAYAFYLSGATSVELPASVASVDNRAFRSSDVASVEVDPANESYASFDGILYDADLTRLLLIPGGRTGAARISSKAEEVDARAFSHCAGVTSVSVDAGSDSYSSWDGLLYDADGTTLLRAPAGAIDITIRDGCTAIAAGALEGCAQLTSITAPASVTSISPDVFTSVPTVSLPAISAVADDSGASTGATEEPSEQAGSILASGSVSTQLTAMVALSSTADDLPEVDPSAITVNLPEGADARAWQAIDLLVESSAPQATVESFEVAYSSMVTNSVNGTFAMSSVTYPYIDRDGLVNDVSDDLVPGFTLIGTFAGTVSWPASAGTAVPADPDTPITIQGVLTLNENDSWYKDERFKNPAGKMPKGYLSRSHRNTYFTLADIQAGRPISFTTERRFVSQLTLGSNAYMRSVGYPFAPLYDTDLNHVFKACNGMADQDQIVQTSFFLTPSGINLPPDPLIVGFPARTGYSFAGWYTEEDGRGSQITAATISPTSATTFYAHWKANKYTVAFDSQGGSAASSVQATYDADVTLPTPTRQGYTFKGWDTKADGTGTRYQAGTLTKPNLIATANGTVTLYAQWAPTISADVPLEVTARVDLLGIEEQEEAQGYIESRCGEPLTVADVAFEPLSGATELFGAASVADVALEVLAAGSTSPDARFALDASASQAPASASAFRMATYGTRVPISYRFAIPDELLPSLTEATKPVCSVAYTVALA